MLMFEHTDVTSRDITRLKKYELVDLVVSLVAGTDVIIEKYGYEVEDTLRRRLLILTGDDVLDYVEEAVDRASKSWKDEEE